MAASLGAGPVPALEVKLGALALLLSVTLLLGISPLFLVRCTNDPELRRRLLSLCSCFAGGVFFATCLLDLLPGYLDGIKKTFDSAGVRLQFPLPEFILGIGFFLVLILEQILLSLKPHSPLAPAVCDEQRSLLDPPFNSIQPSEPHSGHRGSVSEPPGQLRVDSSSQSALRALILVFSLSLHSVFEGLAVGLVEDSDDVMEMCSALVIHKSLVALSLCFRLLRGRLRRSAVASCLLLFSVMSPLGVALGVALTEEMKSSSKQQLIRSSLEGLAGGMFVYITFMEILPQELQGQRNNMPNVCVLLLGFALVTGVLFLKL